jgi:hypothetical protein
MEAAVQTTTPAVAEKVPLEHGSEPTDRLSPAYEPGDAVVQLKDAVEAA